MAAGRGTTTSEEHTYNMKGCLIYVSTDSYFHVVCPSAGLHKIPRFRFSLNLLEGRQPLKGKPIKFFITFFLIGIYGVSFSCYLLFSLQNVQMTVHNLNLFIMHWYKKTTLNFQKLEATTVIQFCMINKLIIHFYLNCCQLLLWKSSDISVK